MKKSNFAQMLLVLLAMTVLLAYDFFPAVNNLISISKPLLITLIIIIVLVSIFSNRTQKEDTKEILRYQVITLLYLFMLIVSFTILGGTSQVGITLRNPVLWIVIAISVFEIFQQKKKLKLEN
jgi:phosphatidylglycerophosphatase A